MTALQELPEFAKDSIFPIIKFSPWATSKEYANSVERVEKAVGNRAIIASIDQSYSSTSKKIRPAVLFHDQIVKGDDREAEWLKFLTPFENLIPCFEVLKERSKKIETASLQSIKLGRGVVLQINIEHQTGGGATFTNKGALVDLLKVMSLKDVTQEVGVLIDCGHCIDLKKYKAEVEALISSLKAFPKIHIILCSGTFPSSFISYLNISVQKIDSRLIFDAVKSGTNSTNLSYSDLSATRLGVSKSSGGSKNTPKRIDYPMSRDWVISRNKDEGWSFQKAAEKLLESEYWTDDRPNIYGVKRIEATAAASDGAITTLGTNATVRINVHLYVQSQYGSLRNIISTDEEYQE